MPTYPFEVSFDEVQARLDEFTEVIFGSLESAFLVMPRGDGFIDYPVFAGGYEALKASTAAFRDVRVETVLPAVMENPIALIVVRSMLGFNPSEWAYMATLRTGVSITQNAARTIDRNIRLRPTGPLTAGPVTRERVTALVRVACELLNEGAPATPADKLHRLDKADTKGGLAAVQSLATIGVPYPMLLYERFLGRPFAGHRDSVSGLIGDSLEVRIEQAMTDSGISYRKTKRAERIVGFDQAPDFIVPDEFSPKVVIEAKISEDDGTARDKVTRVQHLGALSREGVPAGEYRFEVIACIGGRGFGVRKADMHKLLLATRGKVFTPATLDRLIENTRLRDFVTREQVVEPESGGEDVEDDEE